MQTSRCIVEGCEKDRFRRAWCTMHYSRIKRSGQSGGPDRVRAPNGEWWLHSDGYLAVTKSSKVVFQHREVMEEILGRALLPEEEVHHMNGIRTDNRPENLELWTKSQPAGGRVEDKLKWAREILAQYGP